MFEKFVDIFLLSHARIQKVLSEGGPTLTTFLGYEGMEDTVGHHRPANETSWKWRFAGVPMMPSIEFWFGSF